MNAAIVGLHRDQSGMVGKLIVGWLVMVLILGIAAIDGTSIALTTFRMSDIAASAASEAAARYELHGQAVRACRSAKETVADQDPEAELVKCRIDDDGTARITVGRTASTFVVGRVPFLEKYGRVDRTESAGSGV